MHTYNTLIHNTLIHTYTHTHIHSFTLNAKETKKTLYTKSTQKGQVYYKIVKKQKGKCHLQEEVKVERD